MHVCLCFGLRGQMTITIAKGLTSRSVWCHLSLTKTLSESKKPHTERERERERDNEHCKIRQHRQRLRFTAWGLEWWMDGWMDGQRMRRCRSFTVSAFSHSLFPIPEVTDISTACSWGTAHSHPKTAITLRSSAARILPIQVKLFNITMQRFSVMYL